MEIHQIAHCAEDTHLKPEKRRMYWRVLRELSLTLQNLRLYENACEGYRRQLMQDDLSENGRKWISEEYSKVRHAVGELKWRKLYLEQIPSFFDFEPIDEVINPQLALPRLYREYHKLVDKRLKVGTDTVIDGRIAYLAIRIERISASLLEHNGIAQNLETIKLKSH